MDLRSLFTVRKRVRPCGRRGRSDHRVMDIMIPVQRQEFDSTERKPSEHSIICQSIAHQTVLFRPSDTYPFCHLALNCSFYTVWIPRIRDNVYTYRTAYVYTGVDNNMYAESSDRWPMCVCVTVQKGRDKLQDIQSILKKSILWFQCVVKSFLLSQNANTVKPTHNKI